MVHAVMGAAGRRRRLVHVPLPFVRGGLDAAQAVTGGSAAYVTWQEAELMEVSMTTSRGTADAESLGVSPRPMSEVLAAR
jgi:hypothetical protein